MLTHEVKDLEDDFYGASFSQYGPMRSRVLNQLVKEYTQGHREQREGKCIDRNAGDLVLILALVPTIYLTLEKSFDLSGTLC